MVVSIESKPKTFHKKTLEVWKSTNLFRPYYMVFSMSWTPLPENKTQIPLCINITELYYSWNRNTPVLLYNLLSGYEERKWLAHIINPYYNFL